jgi:AraC-like DNA-binding protein
VKLSEFARECGLSVRHFARSFKISFGVSVHQWIIAQRVERSKDLLLRANISLVEVAFLADFCDQAAFNRAFGKFTGQTPGRWRGAVKDFRNETRCKASDARDLQ